MRDPARRSAVTACTVVTPDSFAAGRVALAGYRTHHPGHDTVLVVLGGGSGLTAPGSRVVDEDWLGIDDDLFARMATALSADELVDAVAPLALARALRDSPVALFLAPHVDVLAPFEDITAAAAREGVVVAPVLLNPLPADGKQPATEKTLFHKGFVAVGRDSDDFLEFWARRARENVGKRRRSWLDLVPGLFRHTVVRDAGVAVSARNLHERDVRVEPDGSITASGAPIRFLDLDGYDPRTPWLFAPDPSPGTRARRSEQPAMARLVDDYDARLTAAQAEPAGDYRYDRFPDGVEMTPSVRALFHDQWQRAEQDMLSTSDVAVPTEVPPHAFERDGRALREWLAAAESAEAHNAGLNRLLVWVWSSRVDLQTAFRDPTGADAEAFRDWCSTHGVKEGLVPRWALPGPQATPRPPDDEFGVNIAGYLTAELGLGEMARVIHRVAQHAEIPLAAVVEERSLWRSCRTALDAPSTVGDARFPVTLITVNSDYTRLMLDSHPDIGHRRYRIGLWAWELEDFPEHLHDGFALVDEIWTVSDFCRRAIEPHSPVPVRVIPVPVLDPGEPDRRPRDPGEPTRFLYAFDFNSTGQRKNPWGLVEAFQRAFPDRADVRLVIKATNGHLHPGAVERLRYVIGTDNRIDLLERYLSVAELNELYQHSDAYVSLHRSEGFGLTVAEAMIRGLPVVATDYGGTTEFFSEAAGWAVPHGMVRVGSGWEPYQADAKWADPDLSAAADAMAAIAADPVGAYERGLAAREHILRTRSMDAAAEWMRQRVTEAYGRWRSGDFGVAAGPKRTDTPLERARAVVTARPDPDAPHRMPFAPTMRRIVQRAIGHYSEHQREVLTSVVDGVRDALDRIERRQSDRLDSAESALAHRVAELEARVDRVAGARHPVERERP